MKKMGFISLAAAMALSMAFIGCSDDDSTTSGTISSVLSTADGTAIAATKVEFIGMAAPSTDDEMAKTYSNARVRVYTNDKDYKEYALSYNKLFGVKDKVGSSANPAGQLYDYKMNPIMDPMGKPLIAETPDANSLLNINGNLYLVTHYEYDWLLSDGSVAWKTTNWYSRAPMSMTLTSIEQKDGKLIAKSQKPIDFSSVDGIWIPCFGTQTPWNTHLGGEEDYDLMFNPASGSSYATTTAGLKAMTELYFKNEKQANPYHYGYITEVVVNPDGSTKPIKHYSMGKGTWEMAKIMPDGKTAYMGDDGTHVALVMYVADKANDLSSGTLYAAKWNQINEAGAKDGGKANLTWIRLGSATDAEVKALADKTKFSDIFDAVGEKDFNASVHTGYTAVKAGHSGIEYLKLKPGMEKAAAFLETKRYAALLGATTEWNKMEGIANNAKDNKLYIAMSYIDRGMVAESGSFATDHIKVAKNNCGGTYELNMKGGVKDTAGNAINSNHVAVDMYVPAALLGEEIKADTNGNTCHNDKIANTDNLFFSEKMRTLFIGEDSNTHVNNYVWAYNVDTQKLSRILSTTAGAEATGLQVIENLNGYSYIMSNAQHQGDWISTMDKNLSSRLSSKIDKFDAPVGYIGGLPGLK